MPRLRVIILDQSIDDLDTYNVVLWADVPAARQGQYARPGAVSAWKDALAQDNTNIATGVVAETVQSQRIIKGSGLPTIEGVLQSLWQQWQDAVTGRNLWQRYGSTWDGTSWVIQNNG